MKINYLRIANNFRFLWLIVVILLFLYLGTNIFFKTNIAERTNKLKYIEIQIKYGDTIWELAKKFTPNDKDIRKTIYEISLINNLDSLDIYPGQVIKIPTDQN
ncbi:LysM peptidoglycan-binding domain-containing protein [Crassaminicella thermophila]|uniref:LysM peptidoglycan-binding domain-containing protein n=1 Tax=Crassaminicella thermophila TaxID=2599308 RepID=A0A5C0SFN8_CRATE|nr:LysM peptidoglycan-binding domain-containing protein [Crassaminicella thermophila]QEK12164.1 LysM peptidoglycan-binding domain-containing protein [Crassaminicella thermophila]